jgi:hypothetical protein
MEFKIYNNKDNFNKIQQLDEFLNMYNIAVFKEIKPNNMLYIVYSIYNSDDNLNSIIYALLKQLRI